MLYKIKQNANLYSSKNIAKNIKTNNGTLTITDNSDVVSYRLGIWYINNISQGIGADYQVNVETSDIIDTETFNAIFEKVE